MATQPEIVSASLAKHVPGQRVVILGRDENGDPHELLFDSVTGGLVLATGVTVSGGDIEIGAVELKDGASDTRAKVTALTSIVSGDNGVGVTDPIGVAKMELMRALLANVQVTDTSSATEASALLTLTGGGIHQASMTDLGSGKVGLARLTPQRAQHMYLVDAAGNPYGDVTRPIYTIQGLLTIADIVTGIMALNGLPIDANSGAVSNQTPRFVLATDQVTPTNPFNVQPIALTNFVNWGANINLNIKATAGKVYTLVATNTNAAVRYIQLHNKATAPAATEVPIVSFPIPAGTVNNPGSCVLGTADLARAFGTGIGFYISTAQATAVAGATAGDHSVTVGYL